MSNENTISNQKQKKHIFLLGYMGSGKTSIGLMLSKKLGVDFIDTDELIEVNAGMSIAEIFSKRGEEYFRKLENQVLNELPSYSPAIVSTGGGMPCHNNGVELMNRFGITLYLEASADVLMNRLWAEKDKRPLISNLKDKKALLDFIQVHLTKRSDCYLKSNYKVNADLNPNELLEELLLIPAVAEKINQEL